MAGIAAGRARPLWIGITSRSGSPEWLQRNTRYYLSTVASYGAVPVVLVPDRPAVLPDGERFEPDADGRIPAAVLDRLDGLVLSGGGDVDPRHFGERRDGVEEASIDPRRDELELALARSALEIDLPMFGVCRGCQVLNVAAGGGLIQHLDGHHGPKDGHTWFHPVRVEPESRLAAVAAAERFDVNTFHHQGIDRERLAPVFRATGFAEPDARLVEAYESAEHRWVVGVQWHPERTFELGDAHRRLWAAYLTACEEYHGTVTR